jgi:sodium-dependent phosphate cotransporter
MIVKNMRALMIDRLEVAIDRMFGANPVFAILVGMVITAIIQSSSITTSLLVPLIGAGAMSLEAAFPITLGANIGTTITAMMAAMAMNVHGLAIAFVHLAFNLVGVLIIYPLKPIRNIPLNAARALARVTVKRKWVALVFIAGLFYGLPLLAFGISHWLGV